LGFEAELRTPWNEDVPELLSETQIQERLEDRPPGLLAALLRAGLVEREANQYLVRSPALLNMTLTLERNGIDIETAQEATAILSGHLSKAAKELSLYFHEHLHERFAEGSAELLSALKPVALDAASVVFAREIQQALEQMLHEGRLAPVGTRSPDSDKTEKNKPKS
jgi:hypothetical protein